MPLNQAANLLLTLGMDLAGRDKLTDFSPLGSVTAMSYWRDVGVRVSVFGTTHDRTLVVRRCRKVYNLSCVPMTGENHDRQRDHAAAVQSYP